MVTWDHVTNFKIYIFPFTRFKTTKFGRMLTSGRRLRTRKSSPPPCFFSLFFVGKLATKCYHNLIWRGISPPSSFFFVNCHYGLGSASNFIKQYKCKISATKRKKKEKREKQAPLYMKTLRTVKTQAFDRHLLVQSQRWIQHNNMRNLFKVNYKVVEKTSLTSIFNITLKYFLHCSSVKQKQKKNTR